MTTKISVITPTADQPTGMFLAERYMRRQTLQPDEWIVADDGVIPATLTMGQIHLARPRTHEGGASLASNILAGLEKASGDVILIWEHDDWYAPNHIELAAERLIAHRATGCVTQRYYNVATRQWILMHNVGSALCNTAFRRELAAKMKAGAERALAAGSYGLDRLFWDSLQAADKDIHAIETVVGIKGLPGRKGLGMGHRPDKKRPWHDDPNMEKLEEWVGRDADVYRVVSAIS